MTDKSKKFTTGEMIGLSLSKFSMWLVPLIPLILFLITMYNMFSPIESAEFGPSIAASLAALIFSLCAMILISSILRISGVFIEVICHNKRLENKIRILEEYNKIHEQWYNFSYGFNKTFLELGLLYKETNEIDLSIKNLELAAISPVILRLGNRRRSEFELAKIHEEKNNLIEARKWLNASKTGIFPTGVYWPNIDINQVENKILNKEINENYPLVDQLENRFYFNGDFEQGIPHGKGNAKFSNNNEYIGEFRKGKIEGEGKFIWANGDVYIGHFKNDQFDGHGKIIWRNGDSYSGQFRQGERYGEGTLLTDRIRTRFVSNCPSAVRYEGQWLSDLKHGLGKCYDEHGKILYSGQFISDYPVGIYPNNSEVELTQKSTGDYLLGKNLKEKVLKKKRAFFSYSKHDKDYLSEFKKHLQELRRAESLDFWDDSMILPGEEWDSSIKAALAQSDIVFLMLSADFLNTEYIWEKEITEAMHRFDKGLAIVIPIKIRACDWSNTPFAKLQGLPRKSNIIGKDPKNDEAWQEVVQDVRDLLERVVYNHK